jgi:hypothetical protein
MAAGTLTLFCRDGSNRIADIRYDSGAWTGWEYAFTQQTVQAPFAASWAPYVMDLFAVDPNGDMVHSHYDNGWSAWEDLGITPLAGAVASWGNARLDVFEVDRGTRGVYDKDYNGQVGGWEAFNQISCCLSGVGVGSLTSGNLQLVEVDTANRLALRAYNLGDPSWSDATDMGLTVAAGTQPSLTRTAEGRVDVVAAAPDGTLRHCTMTASGAGAWDDAASRSGSG